LESNGCLQTEQRFAPPNVIKAGGSVVTGILKFIQDDLQPPVLTPGTATLLLD
jgi:hypothetical protein